MLFAFVGATEVAMPSLKATQTIINPHLLPRPYAQTRPMIALQPPHGIAVRAIKDPSPKINSRPQPHRVDWLNQSKTGYPSSQRKVAAALSVVAAEAATGGGIGVRLRRVRWI